MLKSLRDLSPPEAELALAEIAQSLLPQPFPPDERPLNRMHQKVLDELYKKLNIDVVKFSSGDTVKVLEALIREISASVLSGPRAEAARARLGRRGDLRLDLYRLTFSPAFDLEEMRGIRRSHVQDALRNPDAVEHLAEETEESMGVTLIAKKHIGPDAEGNFVLLVQALRNEDQLGVAKAVRIYYSDVDLRLASKPVDMLKAFLAKYGVPFYLPTLGPVKYLIGEFIPGDVNPRSLNIRIPGFEGVPLEGVGTLRPTTLGVMHIPLAYFINSEQYVVDLRRHNVQVSPSYIQRLRESRRAGDRMHFQDIFSK
jgi:hypothetical protein